MLKKLLGVFATIIVVNAHFQNSSNITPEVPESLSKTPELSNIGDLSPGAADIAKATEAIKNLIKSSTNGGTTFGQFVTLFCETFNVPFNVDALPDDLRNIPLTTSSVANALTERHAKKQSNRQDNIDDSLFDNFYFIPYDILKFFGDSSSSNNDVEEGPNRIFDELIKLKQRGNPKLGEVGEIFAELYHLPYAVEAYPKDIRNILVNIDDFINGLKTYTPKTALTPNPTA